MTEIHPVYLGKTCTKCKEHKSLDLFHAHKQGKQGKRSKCKDCYKEQVNTWKAKNPDKVKSYTKKSRQENIERYRKTYNKWQSNNRPIKNAVGSIRRARKLNATPKWLTDRQKAEMLYKYSIAKEAEILTGDKYHVDHIVPLVNDVICGLHVPWNLQVLPSDLNLKKNNTFVQEYV